MPARACWPARAPSPARPSSSSSRPAAGAARVPAAAAGQQGRQPASSMSSAASGSAPAAAGRSVRQPLQPPHPAAASSQQQQQPRQQQQHAARHEGRLSAADASDESQQSSYSGSSSSQGGPAVQQQGAGQRRNSRQLPPAAADDSSAEPEHASQESDDDDEDDGSGGNDGIDRHSYDDAASLRSAYTADTYYIPEDVEPPLSEAEANQVLQGLIRGMPDYYGGAVLAHAAKYAGKQLAPSLMPKLNDSGVLFADLLPDVRHPDGGIRQNNTTIKSFRVKLAGARDIPPPGAGAEVKHRMVRVCLLDSNERPPLCYISNIHGFSAICAPNKPLEWKFPSKGGLFAQRNNEDVFLVRTSHVSESSCLLFELSLFVKRHTQGR
eukprot:TRINITY_DN794_c0_g2_i3.p2 TRINITY_DN794_c0_g2~~TRINITY_DN794_c0_g2_i3.p2  ORF type:complete len:381 (+),score=110.04 TRINITY_DN794_c0_g2_i3:950-2092(+)